MTTFTPSPAETEKRAQRANCRWKSTLEEMNEPQFPRETDRNYNVANFLQERTSYDSLEHAQESQSEIPSQDRQDNRHVIVAGKPPASPISHPVISPLSPSIYSRNTDGVSILPNDSVVSFVRPEEQQLAHTAGSAVISKSQSVRSYVIGTPSPRRLDSTRTSRDWKAWLSHEISGMEHTTQEDLQIDHRYTTSSDEYLSNIACLLDTEHDDTTAILCQVDDASTKMPVLETPSTKVASGSVPEAGLQDHSELNNTSGFESSITVLEKSESHPDTFKEVTPCHTPSMPTSTGTNVPILTPQPGFTPALSRNRRPSTPSCFISAQRSVLETPSSSRMNDRFPFIDTGRRSSSNSAKSSRHSKSPPESIASLKSMHSSKASPCAKVYSDFSAPITKQTFQRLPNTALKRSDALHGRKENATPSSLRDRSRSNISLAVHASRPKTLQPLSSAALNRNTLNMGQYMTNSPEVKHNKHDSSPATTPVRSGVRVTLRPISPDKLTRRPRSAFDLRGTTTQCRPQATNKLNPTTMTSPFPPSELYVQELELRILPNSSSLNKDCNFTAEERITNDVLIHDRSGSVTPGQRMANRFLEERKSTPTLDGGRMRGGLRLAREDTPAFL